MHMCVCVYVCVSVCLCVCVCTCVCVSVSEGECRCVCVAYTMSTALIKKIGCARMSCVYIYALSSYIPAHVCKIIHTCV